VVLLRSIVLFGLACVLAFFGPNADASAETSPPAAADAPAQQDGYVEALAAAGTCVPPPCGQYALLTGEVFSAAAHAVQLKSEAQFSLSAFSYERPCCYAAALLSQTQEADRRRDDGSGWPASLSCSVLKGPFGGPAAAHARL
jgi:hypothetical protein